MDRRILLLDDDDDFRFLMGRALRQAAYSVIEADTAAGARAALAGDAFALLVVDGVLPDGLGEDFVAAVRSDGSDVPVVFVTAFWQDERASERLTGQLGVHRVIRKPFVPEELIAAVDAALGAPERGSADQANSAPAALDSAATGAKTDAVMKLRALRQRYVRHLKDELVRLRSLTAEAEAGGGDVELLSHAEQLAQRIRTAAGTYGLGYLSATAAQIESCLQALLANDAGPGSPCWVDLRAAVGDATADKAVEAATACSTPGAMRAANVLVVETDRRLLAQAERLGKRQLINLLSATSFEEAVRILQRMHLDAALLSHDLEPPGSALELIRLLRAAADGPVPVAIMSADQGLSTRISAVHMGASLYVDKPVTADSLDEALRSLLAIERQEELRVLTLDDDPHFTALIRQTLAPESIDVMELNKPEHLLDALDRYRPNMLLLDVHMPDVSGWDICRVLRITPLWRDLPILFLTGDTSAEARACCFQAGGSDYLPKPIVRDELIARLRSHLHQQRLARERAEIDPLTGLLNRRAFHRQLTMRLSEAGRHGLPLSLALLDIDHFKQVNDEHGHLAGDAVLARLGELLSSRLRPEDLRGRWGGEELVVSFMNEQSAVSSAVIQRLLDELGAMTFQGDAGEDFRVTFSAGIAQFPADGHTLAELLRVADARLYGAKRAGRNRVRA